MSDKSQTTTEELANYMKKLKDMDIINSKKIASNHINVAMNIAQSQKNLDYLQVYNMEGACILGETKDIPN